MCAKWLASKPKTWKVADFGCGDAQCVPCPHNPVMNEGFNVCHLKTRTTCERRRRRACFGLDEGFMMHVPICASHTRTAGGTPILNPLARFPGGLSLVLLADATRRTCSPVQARQDREAVRHVARPGRQDTGACGSAVILASLPSRAPLPRVAAAAHSAGGDGAPRMTQYSDTKVQAPRL